MIEPSRKENLYGGLLMVLVGAVVVCAGAGYGFGSLSSMGPGFFPVTLGILLAVLGLCMVGGSLAGAGDGRAAPVAAAAPAGAGPEWRGWLCIIGGLAAFVVLGRYGGLLPASVGVVLVSAMGDRQQTLRSALALTLVVCLICVMVLWWLLQVQLPLFAWGN